MLIELKKGNKIYIKPKNRGKFTKYCHGKVTDECIQRGKNSSNPAIRKRATFAANARKWKHKEGGIIKADMGTKFSNWLNSDLGQSILNGASQLYNGIFQNSQLSKQQDEFNKSIEAKRKFGYNNIDPKQISQKAKQNILLKQQMYPNQNFGEIDLQQEQKNLMDEARAEAKNQTDQELAEEQFQFNNQINAIKGENTASLINGLFNIGKTALLNYKPKKATS